MYGDQCGEFGCGSWGLKSYVTMVTIRTTEMRSSKKQLRIWFRLEKQQICTCLKLFFTFPCRRYTTTVCRLSSDPNGLNPYGHLMKFTQRSIVCRLVSSTDY